MPEARINAVPSQINGVGDSLQKIKPSKNAQTIAVYLKGATRLAAVNRSDSVML